MLRHPHASAADAKRDRVGVSVRAEIRAGMSGVGTVGFAQGFVRSEAFKALFHEGMALVEASASYLDGPGRDESRRLPPREALAYARESMQLTTRLMQIAAWLLVQRAVAEGEIDAAQAAKERSRVRLTTEEPGAPGGGREALPQRLRDLIALAARLHARLLHLDRLTADREPAPAADNAVMRQRDLLRSAFGRTS